MNGWTCDEKKNVMNCLFFVRFILVTTQCDVKWAMVHNVDWCVYLPYLFFFQTFNIILKLIKILIFKKNLTNWWYFFLDKISLQPLNPIIHSKKILQLWLKFCAKFPISYNWKKKHDEDILKTLKTILLSLLAYVLSINNFFFKP